MDALKNYSGTGKLPIKLGISFGIVAFLLNYISSQLHYISSQLHFIYYVGIMRDPTLPIKDIVESFIPFVFGISVGYVVLAVKNKAFTQFQNIISIIFFATCLIVYTTAFYHFQNAYRLVHQIPSMNDKELSIIVDNYHLYPVSDLPFILSAVVLNNNVDSTTLDHITNISESILYRKLWSQWGLMGKNEQGESVMVLIASSNKASPQTMQKLAQSSVLGIGDVHKALRNNPHTPPDILRDLAKDALKLNAHGMLGIEEIIANPNAPSDLVEQLKKKREEYQQ